MANERLKLAGVTCALGVVMSAGGAPAQPQPSDTPPPGDAPPPVMAPPAPPDPELPLPLTPLDQFTVQAPQEVAKAPAAPPPVRYVVEVNGLSAIGLERRFRELSSLEEGRGKAATRLQIQARANA